MGGVELLFGPMLLGVVLNLILYGMSEYRRRFPKCATFARLRASVLIPLSDLKWIRLLMHYLMLVETANVVVELGIIFEPLIVNYGKPEALIFAPKLMAGDPIFISIVAMPIQVFTAWRLKVITRSYIMPAVICVLSLTSFGFGALMSINVGTTRRFSDFGKFTVISAVWLTCSAVCDLVIAISMSYALLKRKSPFAGNVNGYIDRIVKFVVGTGSMTAAVALTDILLFLLVPRTSLNFLVDFPLSNLYTISMITMLLSRDPAKLAQATSTTQVPQLDGLNEKAASKRATFSFAALQERPAFDPVASFSTTEPADIEMQLPRSLQSPAVDTPVSSRPVTPVRSFPVRPISRARTLSRGGESEDESGSVSSRTNRIPRKPVPMPKRYENHRHSRSMESARSMEVGGPPFFSHRLQSSSALFSAIAGVSFHRNPGVIGFNEHPRI
ncbi:unnamed protein product [Mycena citricolor]|uniref:DUF6534 domain-containing protein n=1 Tax=Mycena citricolor TaxID=2018698 RepID=A0AAD2HX74_9AGAR|nr:unnamed protein product [Mycena citricolor]CAK5283851.1 unnamed protein product [Mycena citricolor]